jgi:hypothetical protein
MQGVRVLPRLTQSCAKLRKQGTQVKCRDAPGVRGAQDVVPLAQRLSVLIVAKP